MNILFTSVGVGGGFINGSVFQILVPCQIWFGRIWISWQISESFSGFEKDGWSLFYLTCNYDYSRIFDS